MGTGGKAMLGTLIVLGAAMQSAATNQAADAWTNCLVRQVERTHRGNATTDAIVDGAMRACAAQELNVRRGMERDFGNYTAAEVSAELNKLNRHTRAEMRTAVARLRGQRTAAAPRAAQPAAGSRVRRPLEFFNKCHYPVRYFIYHIGSDGKWRTHGWYNAPANQAARGIIDTRRRPVLHLEGERLYSYAETTGGPTITWYGKQPVTFGGARYSTLQSSLSVVNGKYQFGVNCAGR